MSTTQEAIVKLTSPPNASDHVVGSLDAQVVLVEYADMECPHCKDVQPILREIKDRLGDRMAIVFRHFPLRNHHPHAQKAAEAVEAAGVQGQAMHMSHLIYEHQDRLSPEDYLEHARTLGLDIEQFQTELEDGRHANKVREDFKSGIRSGVKGTPSFFINGVLYEGAWDFESLMEAIEKPLGVRISLLAQEFTRRAASGGIFLLIASLIALFLANSNMAQEYFHFWEESWALSTPLFEISEHLLEWVNGGLMAIFFFVVGLEIKREIQTGELATARKAALPILGAVGGMVMPALLFLAFNFQDPVTARGWGVPMATDIAFTLGILTLLGSRAPLSLKIFFTALAIADDIGGILVIAIFYTETIYWGALAAGGLILLVLIGLNISRVYNKLPYAILGVLLWLAFLESGLHPTIAGVLLALTIPGRRAPNTKALLAQAVTVMDEFEEANESEEQEQLRPGAIQKLEVILERLQSPAQRLERDLTPLTTYLILPIFALANAGVAINASDLDNLFSPVSLGIIAGLVIGKPLGISLFAWAAVKLKIAELPGDMNFAQLISASFLAGVGFTLSLFIANSAFPDPAVLASAKLAIIMASVLAAIIGTALMLRAKPEAEESTSSELIAIEEIATSA
jgi:NhaA family Na+:H+ antiporter